MATNATPHEWLLKFNKYLTTGIILPAGQQYPWNSKHEPQVNEVKLLEVNLQYAHIRKLDGNEATVSLKHLAPKQN